MKKIILFLWLLFPFMLSAQFAGGSGSVADPWQVATQAQLDSVRNYLDSAFVQTANINIDSALVPIGNGTNPFGGIYTGVSGGTIWKIIGYDKIWYPSNISNDTLYSGIFGVVSGTVQNVYMQNFDISGNKSSGYYDWGEHMYGACLVAKTTSTATIINNTINGAAISMQWDWLGQESPNKETNHNFGFFVGENAGTVRSNQLKNSYIFLTNYVTKTMGFNFPENRLNLGGIVGKSVPVSSVYKNAVYTCTIMGGGQQGYVTGSDIYVGGIVGRPQGIAISDCYVLKSFIGTVSGLGTPQPVYAGGIVGYRSGTISECWTIIDDPLSYETNNANFFYFNSDQGSGSISSSSVYSPDYVDSTSIYTVSSSQPVNSDTTGMKQLSFWTSKGYDFTSTWDIHSDYNYGFPFLQGQELNITLPSPAAPILLQPVNLSTLLDNVDLTTLQWTSSQYATSYDWYLGEPANFEVIYQSGNTTSLSKKVYNLEYDKQYYWKIVARNDAGNTTSDVWSFTVGSDTTVSAIAKAVLVAPEYDTTGLVQPYNFKWNVLSGATSYRYQFFYGSVNELESTSADTIESISSLGSGKTYTWRVRGESVSDTGQYSNYGRFTTQYVTPDTIIRISPTNVDSVQILDYFTWYSVDGTNITYNIELTDTNVTPDTIKVWDFGGTTNGWMDTTAIISDYQFNDGEIYSYRMRSKNPTDSSAWTSSWSFYVGPPVPPDPILPPLPPVGNGGAECDSVMTGTGTDIDPYIIFNSTQLEKIDSLGLDKYYKLGCHIDYNDSTHTMPIGNFTGQLDGNYYEIRNVTMNFTTGSYDGFFQFVGSGSLPDYIVIKNLTIRGWTLNKTGSQTYTGLLGGSVSSNTLIWNVHAIKCSVIVSGSASAASIGGLFGTSSSTNIDYQWVSVDSCYIYRSPSASSTSGTYMGGIVSRQTGDGDMRWCWVSNTYFYNGNSGGSFQITGALYASGSTSGFIFDCYSLNNWYSSNNANGVWAGFVGISGIGSFTRSYSALPRDAGLSINNEYYTLNTSSSGTNYQGCYFDTTGLTNTNWTAVATGGNMSTNAEMLDSAHYVDRTFGTWFEVVSDTNANGTQSWYIDPLINGGYPYLDYPSVSDSTAPPNPPAVVVPMWRGIRPKASKHAN